MTSKEYGRPNPVESQLGSVKHERKFRVALKATTIAPHQIRGVAHRGVQVGPNWREHPIWRTPVRFIQTLSYNPVKNRMPLTQLPF